MKTFLMISSLLAGPLYAASAQVSVSWVQTPFWQTAFHADQVLNLQAGPPELNEECKDFERYVWNANGTVAITDAVDYQSFNQMPLPSDMVNTKFMVEFKLNLPLNNVLSESDADLKPELDAKSKSDLLPDFTQSPGQLLLKPESLRSTSIRPQRQIKSLLAVADKLAIQNPAPVFVEHVDGIYLKVSNKDLACDLLTKRASLSLKAKGEVKITLQNQLNLQKHYAEVERISLETLKQFKNPRQRAALLGYRLGGQFSQSFSREKAETVLLQTMDLLFDWENLEPSPVWNNAFDKKALNISGTSPQVDLNLQVLGPL